MVFILSIYIYSVRDFFTVYYILSFKCLSAADAVRPGGICRQATRMAIRSASPASHPPTLRTDCRRLLLRCAARTSLCLAGLHANFVWGTIMKNENSSVWSKLIWTFKSDWFSINFHKKHRIFIKNTWFSWKSVENPFDLKVQISVNQTDEYSLFVMVPHRILLLRRIPVTWIPSCGQQ